MISKVPTASPTAARGATPLLLAASTSVVTLGDALLFAVSPEAEVTLRPVISFHLSTRALTRLRLCSACLWRTRSIQLSPIPASWYGSNARSPSVSAFLVDRLDSNSSLLLSSD